MTNNNIVLLSERRKKPYVENIQPSNLLGQTVKAWGEALNEKLIFRISSGAYNLQFKRDDYGFFWKTWTAGDFANTVRTSSRCIVRKYK